jgi:hypothetical protein
MNVEYGAKVSPPIRLFFRSTSTTCSKVRINHSDSTLLLKLDSTTTPYDGSLSSMSQIRLNRRSFDSCLTSTLPLRTCLNLLNKCVLKTPSRFLGAHQQQNPSHDKTHQALLQRKVNRTCPTRSQESRISSWITLRRERYMGHP